ncbi:MAG: hypothetical protein WCT53_03365 [Candidatus Gracilibacteria bacterium]
MKKQKLQAHHLYLGAGGMFAVAALVIALTFGLSSAQTSCPAGQFMCQSIGACADGPTCDAADAARNGGQVQPPATCPAGMTGVPPNCQSAQPATITCPNGVTAPTYNDCPRCPDGVTTVPAAGCPQQQPQMQPCPNGTSVPVGTTCPVDGANQCPSSTPIRCGDGSCRVAAADCGNVQPPAGQCPQNMPIRCTDNSCAMTQLECSQRMQVPPTNMPVCAAGQQPTATVPCRMEGTMPPAGQCPQSTPIRCTDNSCAVTQVECSQRTQVPPTNMPVCAAGQQPTATRPCRMEGTMPPTNCPMGQHMYNNRCVQDMRGTDDTMTTQPKPYDFNQDMLDCTDEWGGQVKMPKTFYDCTGGQGDSCNPPMATNTQSQCVQKDMTCDSWAQQRKTEQARFEKCNKNNRGPNTMNPMNQMGQKGQFMPQFDCAKDYNNPFCKSGNFGQDQFSQFDDMFGDMNMDNVKLGANIAQEIKRLKQEAVLTDKNNVSVCRGQGNGFRPRECDLTQAADQLKEISLQAGISCPAAAQIQSIITQSQTVFDEIRALSSTATEDEVMAAMAKFDTLRGGPNGDGILSQLFGGWDNEKQEQRPGLMQSLDSCRQIGFIMRDAQRELSNFKHLKDTAEYKALEKFASNPLSSLPAGVDIFATWQPDFEKCGNMMGPMNGGGMGPMNDNGMNKQPMKGSAPMGNKDFGSAFDRGGMMDQNFGSDNGMDKKFDFGFNSVLLAQNPGNTTDMMPTKVSMGGPMCGFFEPQGQMDKECMPPAQRYLGMPYGVMKDLVKALVNKGCESEQAQQSKFSCDGIKEASVKFSKEGKMLPTGVAQKVKVLIDTGTKACDAGDEETASANFEQIMQMVMPFVKGPMNFVKFDKQAYADIGDRNDLESDELTLLKAEIAALKDQMAAMDQRYQDLLAETAKLSASLGEAKDMIASLGVAKEQLARLTGNTATSTLGRQLTERTEQVIAIANEVIPEVPQEAKAIIADVLNNDIAGGMSSDAASDVKEAFDALSSQVNSDALTNAQEIEAVKAFQDTVETIMGSEDELAMQRSEGVIAAYDCPMNEWQGSWCTLAAANKLVSTENKNFGIANPETYNQAVVRVVRLAAGANPEEFDNLDARNATLVREIPGMEPWARPFWASCQAAGVADCLNPPVTNANQPIEREEMASLVVNALDEAGVDLPDISGVAAPTDVAPEFAEEVRTAKAMGIMGGCTGTDDANFCGSGELTVAMDLVVAVKTNEFVDAVAGAEVRGSADDSSIIDPLFDEGDANGIIDPLFDEGDMNSFGDGPQW